MNIIPPFLRPRSSATAASLISSPQVLGLLPNVSESGAAPTLDQVADGLQAILQNFLQASPPGLPAASVSIVTMNERSVGLGNRVGMDMQADFAVRAVKGIRIEAVVRFQLWNDMADNVDAALTALNNSLLAARDALRGLGVLRLTLENSSPVDFIGPLSVWRKSTDFRVLYEFRYRDSDGAESLIAEIPVQSDLETRNSPAEETTVVTDETVRWDDASAQPLVVRGPLRIEKLSALAFIQGAQLMGQVFVTRTFDGAIGLPAAFMAWDAFLQAVSGPNAVRHAQIAFPSLNAFLDVLSTETTFVENEAHAGAELPPITLRNPPVVDSENNRISLFAEGAGVTPLTILYDGDPAVPASGQVLINRPNGELTFGDTLQTTDTVAASYATAGETFLLGDWDADGQLDAYSPRSLRLDAPIELERAADRFEIAFGNTKFDAPAVLYLRVRG